MALRVDPSRVGRIVGQNGELSVEEVNANLQHVRIATEAPTDSAFFAKLFEMLAEKSKEPNATSDGWAAHVPEVLKAALKSAVESGSDAGRIAAIDEIVEYMCMLVAIDFRHWNDSKDSYDSPEDDCVRSTGEAVTVRPFYTTVGESPVRGSMAMVALCKHAVDTHHFKWYRCDSPASLDEFAKCFKGVAVDLKTPMFMPATARRHALVVEINAALKKSGMSFGSIARSSPSIFGTTGFVERLFNLHPRYDDSNECCGTHVFLLKLAQLTVVGLESAFVTLKQDYPAIANDDAVKNVTGFVDFAKLSVCSDYQLPRALRAAKLIIYDEHLASLIDRSCVLAVNSREEVEIRVASTVAATALQGWVQESLGDAGTCTVAVLDFCLWFLGRGIDPAEQMHHLTKTEMY